MSIVNINALKNKFKAFCKPSEKEFHDLIDTLTVNNSGVLLLTPSDTMDAPTANKRYMAITNGVYSNLKLSGGDVGASVCVSEEDMSAFMVFLDYQIAANNWQKNLVNLTVGPIGDKGDAGVEGPKGDKGDAGVQGPKGDKGEDGTPVYQIAVSQSSLAGLISSNGLVPGVMYKITGVDKGLYDDGTNSGTTIYLKAITPNRLSEQGVGQFFNPKYSRFVAGYGIYNNIFADSSLADIDSGTIENTEGTVTGLIVANGFVQMTSGAWSDGDYYIDPRNPASPAITLDYNPDIKSYAIGDSVIYGGYLWISKTGNYGAPEDLITLNATDWEKVAYGPYYNVAYDPITYNVVNDKIMYRKEVSSNIQVFGADEEEFRAIAAQQWGNPLRTSSMKGCADITVKAGAINESVNFRGKRQRGLHLEPGAMQYSCWFGTNVIQESVHMGMYSLIGNVRTVAHMRDITLHQEAKVRNVDNTQGELRSIRLGYGAVLYGVKNRALIHLEVDPYVSLSAVAVQSEAQSRFFSEIPKRVLFGPWGNLYIHVVDNITGGIEAVRIVLIES